MRRLGPALIASLAVLALSAPAAQADFGLFGFNVELAADKEGSPAAQAGSHPYSLTTSFGVNFDEDAEERLFTEGRIKDVFLAQMPGLVADATAFEPCPTLDFLEDVNEDKVPDCPVETQVGITAASSDLLGWRSSPVFLLSPPPGALLRIGWNVAGEANIVIDVGVNPAQPHNGLAASRNIPQTVDVIGSVTELWGDPTHSDHDALRGPCLKERRPEGEDFPLEDIEGFRFEGTGELCAVPRIQKPLLTVPTRCGVSLATTYEAISWNDLNADGRRDRDQGTAFTPPFSFCGSLPPFDPTISAQPTSKAAESPTGLDFELAIEDEGLTSPRGTAKSHIRAVEVTLPKGMTANPSLAEGLEVCSIAQLRAETLSSQPGQGCPQASKIGTIEVDSPLAPETVHGSLHQAEPYANLAGDSLIAFYIVLRNRNLGVLVKQAVRVEADPRTGQLRAITEEVPQLPFSSFRLKFREGARSPLITPPTCDPYTVQAKITPWSGGPVAKPLSTFQVISGPAGGPCPRGAQPFEPGFQAGTLSNAAGAHSPFSMRLTRRDGDQDLTRFDAVLPPGVTARLAGVPWCPEAAIARARGRDGKDELRSPSCPAASQIGSVQGGAGVGSQLTYVPGKVYLAGPVGGAPISVVGIVPAVAGPFDVGTIVVRQALDLDPITGQAKVVSSASDDLPHILAGIPLRVRDIQVNVNRPDFTLNPTSCNPMAVLAGIWGGGSDVFSGHDDFPVLRSARFQAASCASLGFEPKLAIKLRGGVKRGAHPALRAHVRPRAGDANFSRAVVTLPTSAFLDQAHIRTICTRVQFAAGAGHGAHCPPGARYGTARAWSPLLDGPVSGPVYLRSSDNNLPDLVAALTGPPSAAVQVELSARIDSVKGGIRSTFAAIPDLPVSRFLLDMQGGKKGLIVNSRHLCHKPGRNRAKANLRGQNGQISRTRPRVIATKCQKRRKAKRKRARRAANHSRLPAHLSQPNEVK